MSNYYTEHQLGGGQIPLKCQGHIIFSKKESSYITGIVLPIDGGISIGLDLGENIGTINESFLNQRKEIMDCEL